MPDSVMALRYQVQILAALGKAQDAAEPVRSLLARTTATERLSVMASLPRLFVRGAEGKAAAEMIEQALQAYSGPSSPQREAALVSAGRAWLLAGDDLRALGLAQQAAQADPRAPGPVLLALELMPRQAAAETMVQGRLQADDAEPALRLAYVRSLTQQQRLGEAVTQLQKVTQQQPDVAGPWLTLGAVELELKHAQAAEKALLRYLALAGERPEDTAHANASDVGDPRIQARLMLAQAAELRNDFAAAERYLLQIEDPQRAADVQARRASLLVRQGKWREARALMQRLPDGTPAQARAKALGEAQILREAKQWREAYAVLGSAVERFGDDADLVYEQAMVAEKMDRLDEMERLLRRVIALKPDHQHAYNALGYSLADRGLRLPEARELIEKALALAPGDPFITDSLGWLEFRTGRHDEALRLLRQAYKSRPDTEIAAHLGEVLWTIGLRDEARRVWSEGRQRDAENEVLRETLSRLKPGL
jgi:tetratricopeptide (TPR) repeat protein